MKRKALPADENSHSCSICQELLVSEPWGKLHPCGHPVHSSCVANWFYTRAKHMQALHGGSVYDAEKYCPLCREEWTLTGAPTVVTTLGASMEVSNLAISLAFSDLLEEKGELRSTSDSDEEDGHEGATPPGQGIDESQTPCRLCSRMLETENWTLLSPCHCCFHVTCLHRHVLTLVSAAGRLPTQLPCPVCKTEVHSPELWDDFVHVYDVRPILPQEWLSPAANSQSTSHQVEVNCFWVLLVRSMMERRDQEVEHLLAVEPLPEEAVVSSFVYQRQDVDELVEICYCCRQPLACNYWLCLSCCHHKFHLRCLCQAAMEVDEKRQYIRVCPVCNLSIVLNRDEVPWFFLWEPLSTAKYPSKFQLHEVAFWWYLDLEANRQQLQGHQIFREEVPSGAAALNSDGGPGLNPEAAESSSANVETSADGGDHDLT